MGNCWFTVCGVLHSLICLIIVNRPQDHKELFNLRHAQLRNVVERIFGALKRTFSIVADVSEYDLATQVCFTLAYGGLFNYNRILDHDEENLKNIDDYLDIPGGITCGLGSTGDRGQLGGDISIAERARAEARRDQIALVMWADYQAELQHREVVHDM